MTLPVTDEMLQSGLSLVGDVRIRLTRAQLFNQIRREVGAANSEPSAVAT